MDITEEIIRNDDGSLTVQVAPARPAGDADAELVDDSPTSLTIRPGEGGYDEALAKWDLQQDPDRGAAVSTASGRDAAMTVVHAVATDPEVDAEDAVEDLENPEESAEALRHVLVGGTPSVEGFAEEVAAAEGGDPLPAHEVTKVIGEVLSEIDT
jgi:hypothetical protein